MNPLIEHSNECENCKKQIPCEEFRKILAEMEKKRKLNNE